MLRAGVILYGLRLTLHDIGQVGFSGVLIDALLLSSTFALALILGTRLFGLDRPTALLIGGRQCHLRGCCGAGHRAVLKAKTEQVAVAISTVVVFGTVAIFLYPAAFTS